jgi:hypothetical protein
MLCREQYGFLLTMACANNRATRVMLLIPRLSLGIDVLTEHFSGAQCPDEVAEQRLQRRLPLLSEKHFCL